MAIQGIFLTAHDCDSISSNSIFQSLNSLYEKRTRSYLPVFHMTLFVIEGFVCRSASQLIADKKISDTLRP
jgi:hypothetical protein